MGIGNDIARAQGNAHGRRDPYGRGTADDHSADCVRYALEIAVLVVDLFSGKPGLINHDNLVAAPFYGSKGHWMLHLRLVSCEIKGKGFLS